MLFTTVNLKEGRIAMKMGKSRVFDYRVQDDHSGNVVVRDKTLSDYLKGKGYKLLSEKKSSHGDYLKYKFEFTSDKVMIAELKDACKTLLGNTSKETPKKATPKKATPKKDATTKR